MKFNRQLFKEAFKQGYKKASKIILEEKEELEASREEQINKLYELIEQDGIKSGKKSFGVGVDVVRIGKNHRWLYGINSIYVDARRGFDELIFKMWRERLGVDWYGAPDYTEYVPFDDIDSLEIRKNGPYNYVVLTLTDSTELYLKCYKTFYGK